MTLTPEQRAIFAEWCESQARDSKAIIEQLAKLGPHGEIVAQREKQEYAAMLIVATKLRAIEDMSL